MIIYANNSLMATTSQVIKSSVMERLAIARLFLAAGCLLVLAGCASAPLTESGSLGSYINLKESNGVLTKARVRVDSEPVLAAKTIRITPTEAAPAARNSGVTDKQIKLIANAVDRSICSGLSQRFEVVAADQPADLSIRAVITHIGITSKTAAGISTVANIGGTAVKFATGLPITVPRLPIGLGGLSVEAEATDPKQQQVAALSWARGADSLTIKARISEEGDAYTLASEFGADFAKLLVTGADPIANFAPSLPSVQGVSEYLGGKPKFTACEQFGRNPGVGNTIGGVIGLPPDWTDSGAQ